MSDGFVMELCGNRAAWQIVPDGIESIDLDVVGNTIIDAGYTGEIKVLFHNNGSTSIKIEQGDKIAQLIPTKVVNFEVKEVDELFQTQRGGNGFGSTGK